MPHHLRTNPPHLRRRARVLVEAPEKQHGESREIQDSLPTQGDTLPASKTRKSRIKVGAEIPTPRTQPALSFAASGPDPEWRPATTQKQKDSLHRAYLTT